MNYKFIKFLKKIILVSILFTLNLTFLHSHAGYPISLYENVSSRVFESLENGTDSYVLKILGANQFESDVLKSTRPVVVKIFYKESIPSCKLINMYQEVAEYFKNKVKFVSVDVGENKELVKQIATHFFNLVLSRHDLEVVNPIMHKNLLDTLQKFVESENENSTAIPFLLFLKNSSLSIPSRYFLEEKELLVAEVKEFFTLDDSSLELENESGKKSFWKNFKDKAVKFFSGEKA